MSLPPTLTRTFSSLSAPNYRKFFYGQSISLIGTWMQITAQSWLVFTLTHSAAAIGLVVALQTLPILLLGPYAGVIADRARRRRLLVILQSLMGLQALVLAVLSITHVVTYLDVCLLAVVLGLNNSFENPARQAFVLEMVGPDDLKNAVGLNSTMNNAARAVGPAVAGILIAAVGAGWCFAVNAVSFVAVVMSLIAMDEDAFHLTDPLPRSRGQLREGLAYVAATPVLWIALVMMTIVGTLTYEFQVTLPLVASRVFHGASGTYGTLLAVMGAGAIVGGLVTAARGRTGLAALARSSALFAVSVLIVAVSPTLYVALTALALTGAASVAFLITANTTLQLRADPAFRGRVMSLWAVAFMGTTPIGAPLIGLIIDHTNPRIGLAVGALAAGLAAAVGLCARHRYRREPRWPLSVFSWPPPSEDASTSPASVASHSLAHWRPRRGGLGTLFGSRS